MRIKIYTVIFSCSVLLLTSGCMSTTIEEEINKTKKENISAHNEKENIPEDIELSKEQKKILDELEKNSAEEALFENDLETREELNIQVPNKQDSFNNPEEFSQYLSYLFFAFYKGDMKPEIYLDELLLYGHSDYLSQLPNDRDSLLNTLKQIQHKYSEQLRSPLESYVITDIHYQERVDEAFFYRKFILANLEEVYSITTLKKDGESWKLYDDSPSTPYLSTEFIQANKTNEEGEGE